MKDSCPLIEEPVICCSSTKPEEVRPPSGRMTVLQIARRLNVGRLAVYAMLGQGIIPAIRLGRRWIITRHAYALWERSCGRPAGTGLSGTPEVQVVLN